MLGRRGLLTLALGLLGTYYVCAEMPESGGAKVAAAVPGDEESAEETLGTQLLSAVLGNDLETASAVFAAADPEQAPRLANAIDWRGKSVLMHAASRNYDGARCCVLQLSVLRLTAAARR
jgi:hypothetical protein